MQPVRIIRYECHCGAAGLTKHLTAEYHTTQLALPDLIPTQKNMRLKNRNDEVNQGCSGLIKNYLEVHVIQDCQQSYL